MIESNPYPQGFHRSMHDEAEDIGGGVHVRYFVVKDALGDEELGGLIISHIHEDGEVCQGSVNFDTPVMQEKFPEKAKWQVQQWEPLTLSPSILQRSGPDKVECLHGYIREGRWESA